MPNVPHAEQQRQALACPSCGCSLLVVAEEQGDARLEWRGWRDVAEATGRPAWWLRRLALEKKIPSRRGPRSALLVRVADVDRFLDAAPGEAEPPESGEVEADLLATGAKRSRAR